MTSSTSNSDQRINHTAPDDIRRHHARRRVALQTLLLGGGALMLGMFLVRALVSYVEHQAPSPFSIERIKASAEAFPAVRDATRRAEDKTVFVLGSSLVEFGFAPDVFDRQLREQGIEATSYNFGYGNADPSIHYLFAKKMAEIFADDPKTIDLVIFEFTPFQTTKAREQSGKKLDQAVKAILSDNRDLLTMAITDPKQAIDLFNIKWVRNGVPSDAITALLGKIVPTDRKVAIVDPEQPPVSAQALQLYQGIVRERSAQGHPGEWFVQDRGGLPSEVSDDTYQLALKVTSRLQNPQRMIADRLDRLRCCDIEGLDFSDSLVNQFIDAVKQAQTVSKRVDVLLMPRNQELIQLTAKGRQNLKVVLEKIRHETGATIVDLSELPLYKREEFFDSDHLSLFGGRLRFSRELAEHYANDELLKSH